MKMKSSLAKMGDNNSALYTFLVALLLSFVGMVATFSTVTINTAKDKAYLENITQMRLLMQQISQHAASAANGKEGSFTAVKERHANFKKYLQAIQNGDDTTNTPITPATIQQQLEDLRILWEGESGSNSFITALLGTKDAVITLYEQRPVLLNLTVELEEQTNVVIKTMMENGATSEQIYAVTHLLMVLERINNNIHSSFKGDESALNADQQLGQDTEIFLTTLHTLLGDATTDAPIPGASPVEEGPVGPEEPAADMPEGADAEANPDAAGEEDDPKAEIKLLVQPTALKNPMAQQAVRSLLKMFETRNESINNFLDTSEQLFNAKDAQLSIFEASPKLLEAIESLQDAYIEYTKTRWISPWLGAVLAVLVLIMLIVLLMAIVVINKARAEESRVRLQEQMKANQRNQEAILRLLSEISDLADGDLTITATVTEDFTGAIADALNFSIDSLRDLVITINKTATQVTKSAQASRQTATQLTEASERQAQQIAKASQAIIGMANSVKKVSANAIESAEVAKKSVEIAGKGAKAVQDTIAGMDNIREQIQETSKRIKRLGESSQEIGEIVGLIDDIADQTNILALNAAIQAAMAGESGRGFAVVADEVQRLAERAGNATKQIAALVKTIQSDTNEAVSSMEQSTSNVVDGAKIAESAGESLIEIENVSVKLAGQIENIAQTSRTQAAVASNISSTMTIIQEITTQTSKGTNETAAAIERLAEQAVQLKNSVSGFKLPEGSLD